MESRNSGGYGSGFFSRLFSSSSESRSSYRPTPSYSSESAIERRPSMDSSESRQSSVSSESRNSGGSGSGFFSRLFSRSSESRSSYRPTPSYSSESAIERRPSMDSSESRQSSVSSESRNTSSSESRSSYRPTPSYSSESVTPSTTPQEKKYNSLDDIDKLIERLEASMSGASVTSDRANQALARRKQKIDELKTLVEAARNAEAEKRMLSQLEDENSELDAAIDSLNKGFRR